jgi:predicted ArsR family transcriptional regulator
MTTHDDAAQAGIRTSDPERIRALAHPVRLALIELLQDGELTASECAERLGQTVANCSFHLRVLAKAGFIERGEPRGREKPWRLVAQSRRLEPDVEVPGSFAAVTELASNFLAHVTQRFTTYLREYAERDDPVWRDATSLNQMTFWATAEEAAQIQEQLERLADPFEGRSTDPALRPEGARRVRLASLIHPDLPTSSTE